MTKSGRFDVRTAVVTMINTKNGSPALFDGNVGRCPGQISVVRGCGVGAHAEVARYLGSTRNEVDLTFGDLVLVCKNNEAVRSGGKKPGIRIKRVSPVW